MARLATERLGFSGTCTRASPRWKTTLSFYLQWHLTQALSRYSSKIGAPYQVLRYLCFRARTHGQYKAKPPGASATHSNHISHDVVGDDAYPVEVAYRDQKLSTKSREPKPSVTVSSEQVISHPIIRGLCDLVVPLAFSPRHFLRACDQKEQAGFNLKVVLPLYVS